MKTEFKVGDRVFSYSLQEWGEVRGLDSSYDTPMYVMFDNFGLCYFTEDGRRSKNDKAPDLFFGAVTIEPPQRPLQDKDIIMCWDDCGEFERAYKFYDAEYNTTFTSTRYRCGYRFDNMVYVPDEEAPQELVNLRDKLED